VTGEAEVRIIPVIDLMGGQVVHAVAGRRSEYRPLRSNIVASTDPVVVAKALIDLVGPEELYLADLDAIAGAEPAYGIYQRLVDAGIRLCVDAGPQTPVTGWRLQEIVGCLVLGLETNPDPKRAALLRRVTGPRDIIFSLDMRGRKLLGNLTGWAVPDDQPFLIAQKVYDLGIRRIIVLDLERVGVGRGTGTEHLCHAIKKAYPDMEVIAGGGIRNREDAEWLAHVGVDAVLVASALHSGTW